MFHIILTLDYEIHGNGDGDPYKLIIEPTERLLNLLEKFGARLTIMADVAEILKFKEYRDKKGEDKFHYGLIVSQLQRAILNGHDVQLHIHSGYFDSEYNNGRWEQNWDEYDLANLPYERIFERIKTCKEFLEFNLRQVKKDYQCIAFRAANWSMTPTKDIYKALVANGIKIDTSVFKYGKRKGRVKFNYDSAFHDIVPWFADKHDICEVDVNGSLLEVPIYCENRNLLAFLTPIRAFRFIRAKFHKHKKISDISQYQEFNRKKQKRRKNVYVKMRNLLLRKHAWKLDFNQAGCFQIIRAINRIEKRFSNSRDDLPIVLIGHSKTFIKGNELFMRSFLRFVKSNPEMYCFSTFQKFLKVI